MSLGAPSFPEIFATTIQSIQGELVDQVLLEKPGLEVFKSVIKSASGLSLVSNIVAGENGKTAWSSDTSGTFSTSVDGEIVSAVQYGWSNPLITPAHVTFMQLEMNAGKDKVSDLMKVHLDAAVRDHAKKIDLALHKPANAMDAGAILSFDAIFGNAASDDAAVAGAGRLNVGGIDSSVHAYWQSTRETLAKYSGDYTDIEAAFRKIAKDIETTSDGSKIQVILAGRKVFDEYEDSYYSKVRYNGNDMAVTADTRFRALAFDGVEVRLDQACDPNTAYFINKDSLIAAYLNDNFMKADPKQVLTGTLDNVTPLVSVLAFGTNQRRANGVLVRDYTPVTP